MAKPKGTATRGARRDVTCDKDASRGAPTRMRSWPRRPACQPSVAEPRWLIRLRPNRSSDT